MSEANPESPQSIVYDHSEKGLGVNLVANGSDWTDSNGDGLADDWGGTNNPSIVTGNGFTGNAQRDEGSGGSGATAGIPLTPDEIRVTMADPGLSAADITVTFVGFTFNETLDLA